VYCVQPIVIQPCQMVLPSNSSESVNGTAGSTIAETLQGLISPGSTVYASGSAVASSIESDATPDSGQTYQMPACAASQLSIPPPIAILAPVDQRAAAQQGAGEVGGMVASSAAVSSRQQPAVCQLVQPSPQGLQDTATLQGVMNPAGTAVYGQSGAQMISTETAAVQSQVSTPL